MMGIVVPETYWAYKKYIKIISGIYLVFILQFWNNDLTGNDDDMNRIIYSIINAG